MTDKFKRIPAHEYHLHELRGAVSGYCSLMGFRNERGESICQAQADEHWLGLVKQDLRRIECCIIPLAALPGLIASLEAFLPAASEYTQLHEPLIDTLVSLRQYQAELDYEAEAALQENDD
ncbi:MAG: hypothetical protein ABIG32_02795 [Candidatus Uhrbacteria bacterium]|nr:hypothetical protein [Patescibacteria group bacterium]MBU1906784.1 hypothetical protein [Patescibacteria group bacterium]